MLYKYVMNMRFIPLSCLKFVANSSARRSPRNHPFKLDLSAFGAFKRFCTSFLYLTIRAFNALPIEIINLPINQFKRSMTLNIHTDISTRLALDDCLLSRAIHI